MDFVIKVIPKGEIELPDEIKAQLRPGDEYQVFLIENSIVLKKIQKELDIKEWFRRIEELGPDPNQPTLEEISKIVKDEAPVFLNLTRFLYKAQLLL